MVFPTWMGVARAKMRSPSLALRWWLMLSWIPAIRRNPEATWDPMLASASAISADIPPCSTLNGCCWYQQRSMRINLTIKIQKINYFFLKIKTKKSTWQQVSVTFSVPFTSLADTTSISNPIAWSGASSSAVFDEDEDESGGVVVAAIGVADGEKTKRGLIK